jgi:hypothetical protein
MRAVWIIFPKCPGKYGNKAKEKARETEPERERERGRTRIQGRGGSCQKDWNIMKKQHLDPSLLDTFEWTTDNK